MDIGEIIRNGRSAQNLSQQELADKLGVHKQSVYRWESNQGSPDIETFKKICNILGLKIEINAPKPIYEISNILAKEPEPAYETLTAKEIKEVLNKIDIIDTRLSKIEARMQR